MICPSLTTKRLTLRAHRPADWEDSLSMWSDPAVVRHIGGAPATAEEVWARLMRYAGHWVMLGFGFWLISDTETGAFLGEAGLADFRRQISPGLGSDPEAGWALSPWAHGRGYAAEAMTAILAWADGNLDAPRTVCIIAPENTPSLTLAEKLGYRPYADGLYRGDRTIMLERFRPPVASNQG